MSPFVIEFGNGFGIRWYGLSYVLAFLLGYLLYRHLARKGYADIHPDKVGDFIFAAAIFGVLLGGRIGYALFYNWNETARDPISLFKVWEGGMASHGGILGLVFFTLYYAKRHNCSWTSIGDSLVVVAPIGLFLVRCANFINGELFGRPTNVSWAMQFPGELYEKSDVAGVTFDAVTQVDPSLQTIPQVIEAARARPEIADILRQTLTPRHPSQIYEAFLEGVVLFCILWFLRTKTRQPRGVLTGAFFICYAMLRIVAEQFREPDAAMTWIFTRGQFLSLFLVLIGLAFLVWGFKAQRYEKIFQK